MDGRQDDEHTLVDNEQPPAIDNNNGYTNPSTNGFNTSETHNYQVNYSPASLEVNNSEIVNIDKVPIDHHNLTYIVFSLLGIATMTPWNFFVTAENYWLYKFRNTTNNDSLSDETDLTPLQKSFTCDLTLTASISGTIFLVLHAIYGHKVSLKLKMLGTLTVILVLFLLTTAFVEVNTDTWQEQFFLITLFTVILLNTSSATMSGALFGISGLFPKSYLSAVVSGQALGGIFTALTLLVVLVFNAGAKTTAFVYFTIGTATILLSIILYIIMARSEFFQYYLHSANEPNISDNAACHIQQEILEPNIKTILSKIYMHAVGICILFGTSLSVYPAVSVLTEAQNYGNGSAWTETYFRPVCNYVLFNCCDYVGRVLAGIWGKPKNNVHTAFLMTILRISMIPFFLCANNNLHQFLPILVHTDAGFILLVTLFGLTNGYLANIFLMMTPRAVLQHEREMASAIMAAALSGGIVLGSVVGMVFVRLL